MNLTLNLTLPQWIGDLEKVVARLKDMTPAMKHGAITARDEMKAAMNQGVSPDGTPFAPLKYPRPIPGLRPKPLLNTGFLRNSLAQNHGTNWFEVGTADMPKARTQHFGATIRTSHWMTIPLTRKAQLAKSARNFHPRLHRRHIGKQDFLVDAAGVRHYVLVKKVVIPPRPFVGTNDAYFDWFGEMLSGWVVTGQLIPR